MEANIDLRFLEHRLDLIKRYLDIKLGKGVINNMHCLNINRESTGFIELTFCVSETENKHVRITLSYRALMMESGSSFSVEDTELLLCVGEDDCNENIRIGLDKFIMPAMYKLRKALWNRGGNHAYN